MAQLPVKAAYYGGGLDGVSLLGLQALLRWRRLRLHH